MPPVIIIITVNLYSAFVSKNPKCAGCASLVETEEKGFEMSTTTTIHFSIRDCQTVTTDNHGTQQTSRLLQTKLGHAVP